MDASRQPPHAPSAQQFEVVDAGPVGGRSRFELLRDGEVVSWADYRRLGNVVVVPHVETVREHRGQGLADRLMEGIVGIVRADDRRIMPLCSFAARYLYDHPEHEDVSESVV